MKNTSRKPYIYKVTNLETHQYYIGGQYSGKTIGVNYFTSSTNKKFKEDFKNYREEKYKIEIIKEFDNPKKCDRAENYMIRNYMQLKDGLCLNRAYHCGNEKVFSRLGTHGWNKGIPCSEETRKKISTTLKGRPTGRPAWNKGIPRSEKTKQKLSEALRGLPAWNKGIPTGRPAWNKGIPRSEKTKQKLSEALKGRPAWNKGLKGHPAWNKGLKGHPAWNKGLKGMHHSGETRKKISESLQGRPAPNRIKISIEGVAFDSLTDAAKYYNVTKPTISYWIKTSKHNSFLSDLTGDLGEGYINLLFG